MRSGLGVRLLQASLALLFVLAAAALLGGLPWTTSGRKDPREAIGPAQQTELAPRIPPEPGPPPFGERGIRLPDPGAPPVSETAALCDESNWARLSETGLRPTSEGAGVFQVDADAWSRALASARAGLASWMSQCQRDGGPIVIVTQTTGERLATYDPEQGLRSAR